MELFHNAKTVRLRSHHDKYLLAEEDEESVCQDRHGSSKHARWTVEFVDGVDTVIRLRSCYDRYLTASNEPQFLGMTGKKVLQTVPRRVDSAVEWEPIREGFLVKLKTRYGNYLRANGGVPPWRNSITHDIPHRSATQEWILWHIDILEVQTPQPKPIPSFSSDHAATSPTNSFSRIQSIDSFVGSPPKDEGRTIFYHIADENGNIDDTTQGISFHFKGNSVEDLTNKLKEETGLEDIVVCTRSPLNGNLYPLHLSLPPNNTTMYVVVALASSKGVQQV